MKHSLSLAGAFALGISLVVASSAAAPATPVAAPTCHPRDFVRIVQGTSFEVPMGRFLELKAISVTGLDGSPAVLEIDGTAVATLDAGGPAFSEVPGVFALPEGLIARPGEVVTMSPVFPTAPEVVVVFGCLSDV